MKKRIALLLAIVLCFTLCITFDTGAVAAADVVIKSALYTQRISRDDDISSFADASLKVSAAKGESDGGQFIVKTRENVSSFDVTVGDLKKGDVVFSKDNFTVYVQIYAETSKKPYCGELPAGYYPDCLLPINYVKEKNENTIVAGRNQGFWVDFTVPTDAEAGVYTGAVTVTLDGKTYEVPVSLEVYDFTIDEAPSVGTCYLIWEDWLMDGELDNTIDKYADYYDLLLDFNITAYYFPSTGVEDYIEGLLKYYSKVAVYGVPYKTTVSRYTLDKDYLYSYLYAIGVQSHEDGINYFDKAYYYFDVMYDEPNDEKAAAYGGIIADTNATEESVVNDLFEAGYLDDVNGEVANTIRGIRHTLTAGYKENYCPDDTTFVPHYLTFVSTDAIEFYSTFEDQGLDVWSYGCITGDYYPMPSYELDDYFVNGRDQLWFDYQVGIDGDLYWVVNGHNNWWDSAGIRYGKLKDQYRTASHDSRSNGDGYLVYPGLLYGSETPFPSLRLVSRRDGIDDYTYLTILDRLYDGLEENYGKAFDAENVTTFINETLLGRAASKLNYTGVVNAREIAADLIEAATRSGLVIDELAVDDDKINYTFYSKEDISLKINGADITAVSTQGGKKYTGTMAIPATEKFDLEFTQGGARQTIHFECVKPRQLKNTFDSTSGVTATRDSVVSLNTSSQYAKSGNSVKVKLSGRVLTTESQTKAYQPSASISLENMKNMDTIIFYLYNASETAEYTIAISAVNGGVSQNFNYDVVTLKKGEWRQIKIDNLTILSRDPSVYETFTGITIKRSNILTVEGAPATADIYIDNMFISYKK